MKQILFIIVMMWFSCTHILAASEDAHRSYDDQTGPEHWGVISVKFDTCTKGQSQAPVNLKGHNASKKRPEIVFEYGNPANMVKDNRGYTIKQNMKPENYVILEGKKYELMQFHFHSPSEHNVNGKTFPMEVHFVHQGEENDYLVVGLLFEAGEHNKILNELPSFKKSRGEDPLRNLIDFHYLITDHKHYYSYSISPNTPPCTEEVRWIVLKQPIIASSEQIQHYRDLFQ